jgi:hypothetical protein
LNYLPLSFMICQGFSFGYGILRFLGGDSRHARTKGKTTNWLLNCPCS